MQELSRLHTKTEGVDPVRITTFETPEGPVLVEYYTHKNGDNVLDKKTPQGFLLSPRNAHYGKPKLRDKILYELFPSDRYYRATKMAKDRMRTWVDIDGERKRIHTYNVGDGMPRSKRRPNYEHTTGTSHWLREALCTRDVGSCIQITCFRADKALGVHTFAQSKYNSIPELRDTLTRDGILTTQEPITLFVAGGTYTHAAAYNRVIKFLRSCNVHISVTIIAPPQEDGTYSVISVPKTASNPARILVAKITE